MPKDLADMGAAFIAKCRAGTAQAHGSGYGGSGFKFDSTEDESQRAQRQVCVCILHLCPCWPVHAQGWLQICWSSHKR